MVMDSTSRVKVEYTDPSKIYPRFSEDFARRLPLKELHWSSGLRPTRSISNLYVELVAGKQGQSRLDHSSIEVSSGTQENGVTSDDDAASKLRRHQIPGLRQTPYLKIYLLQCDDIESYKATARKPLRDWVKSHTPSQSSTSLNKQDNHDAFDWIIIHVIPPLADGIKSTSRPPSGVKISGNAEKRPGSSRWPSRGSTSVIEKLRSEFNSTSKNAVDRVAQVQLSEIASDGASQADQRIDDGMNGWDDLVFKLKARVLASFDLRVSQYEDDIKERDGQKNLIGWNFNTFFVLKEGLAMGFESMGLLDDALTVYQELAIGLGKTIDEQGHSREQQSAHFEEYTEGLYQDFKLAQASISNESTIDRHNRLQAAGSGASLMNVDRKPFRQLILNNRISIFDFQCYLFARQTLITLQLANTLIYQARPKIAETEQGESSHQDQHTTGNTISSTPRIKEPENLLLLTEVVTSALNFIISITVTLRQDLLKANSSLRASGQEDRLEAEGVGSHALENFINSWTYSASQIILEVTSARFLTAQIGPVVRQLTPKAAAGLNNDEDLTKEDKALSREELPVRTSSLSPRNSKEILPFSQGQSPLIVSLESPKLLPPGNLHPGAQGLAAARGDLVALQRRVLHSVVPSQKSWRACLSEPLKEEMHQVNMHDVKLHEESDPDQAVVSKKGHHANFDTVTAAGLCNEMLFAASQASEDLQKINEVSVT